MSDYLNPKAKSDICFGFENNHRHSPGTFPLYRQAPVFL